MSPRFYIGAPGAHGDQQESRLLGSQYGRGWVASWVGAARVEELCVPSRFRQHGVTPFTETSFGSQRTGWGRWGEAGGANLLRPWAACDAARVGAVAIFDFAAAARGVVKKNTKNTSDIPHGYCRVLGGGCSEG